MKKGLVILMAAIVSTTIGSTVSATPAAGEKQAPPAIRIAVCGDSTVASNPDFSKSPNCGWGQVLGEHFQDYVEVVNLSSGGQSSKSFLETPAKYPRAMELKPQYVFIQFGHNDMPGKGPHRETDPNTTYSDNLRTMIDKAHAIGAECILVTSMERRGFDKSGKIVQSLKPYSDAVKRVGKEKGVFVIDLHDKSVEIYEKLGKKAAQEQLGPYPDKDGTHFNQKGASLWADIICQELPNAGPKYDTLKNALKRPAQTSSIPSSEKK